MVNPSSAKEPNNDNQKPNSNHSIAASSQSSLSRKILLVNGPNLNLLGKREPEIYGCTTLYDIEQALIRHAREHQVTLIALQSNHEGELIEAIQQHGLLAEQNDIVDAIIINPAAFTHSSVAIRDAILATKKPFIEVHLSNVHQREAFRQHSYFSDVATGVICGLGAHGYHMALDYWLANLYNIPAAT
ncbi:type II 3-dehydroquinate dehydratase [Psychrobacter pygoscelis]|uniref:type II 3-dehydroquinate dehydratase n=1 Tax=Psychrobacter pygoscelis TaxID=2488563 RepID=UPI001038A9DE|nr:type II 3-dehydroquinate dehydratase [Psychrobacter pygoscelis]